jgi:hypothetical protein
VRKIGGTFFVLFLLSLAGCSSGVPEVAVHNKVFYAYDSITKREAKNFEKRYPPLDLEERAPNPQYLGYTVLNGKVRISKPTNWLMRNASNAPGQRIIQYISPNEYIFTIYEWQELPETPWRDVIDHYEKETEKTHGKFLAKRIPMATWNAQGRAYEVERKVPAAKTPYQNQSREYLIRSRNRVILVQIVHQGKTLEKVHEELERVISTLQVLLVLSPTKR